MQRLNGAVAGSKDKSRGSASERRGCGNPEQVGGGRSFKGQFPPLVFHFFLCKVGVIAYLGRKQKHAQHGTLHAKQYTRILVSKGHLTLVALALSLRNTVCTAELD